LKKALKEPAILLNGSWVAEKIFKSEMVVPYLGSYILMLSLLNSQISCFRHLNDYQCDIMRFYA
jgi:hypothetical protein